MGRTGPKGAYATQAAPAEHVHQGINWDYCTTVAFLAQTFPGASIARTLAEIYAVQMEKEALHTSWTDVAVETMNPLLTRQFVTGEQAMLARLALKKGCVVPRHAHPNEQISYILEGALRFRLGEEDAVVEKTVRAGEVLVIPGGLAHSAEALEDSIDFDVFAPPRQDWLTRQDSYLR
jgi:quercetin dioxygenase-like cupin family protein